MNEIESKINLNLWAEEIQTKLDALRYLKDKRALLSCEVFRLINEATKDCTRALTCTADGYTFVYRWLKTATGFKHVCEVYRLEWGFTPIVTAKRCYYNRTWERFEYESVMIDAINALIAKNVRIERGCKNAN